ncbi:hypothetical protein [Aliikangiella maris]|uniref:Uncharacterized protein n=2 Tax=Aliikangiella maris TaxID=3162458 RepID=A0ABV2BSB1_9GAMM
MNKRDESNDKLNDRQNHDKNIQINVSVTNETSKKVPMTTLMVGVITAALLVIYELIR